MTDGAGLSTGETTELANSYCLDLVQSLEASGTCLILFGSDALTYLDLYSIRFIKHKRPIAEILKNKTKFHWDSP